MTLCPLKNENRLPILEFLFSPCFVFRIMVGLPEKNNREKILRAILEKESVADDLDYGELATMTEGYSGSDLKVGCVCCLNDDASLNECEEYRSFIKIEHLDSFCMFVSLVGSLLVMILQNLCTVAAYRPLKELLKQEKVLMRTLLLESTENGIVHMQSEK